jgi:hypothetical protein
MKRKNVPMKTRKETLNYDKKKRGSNQYAALNNHSQFRDS